MTRTDSAETDATPDDADSAQTETDDAPDADATGSAVVLASGGMDSATAAYEAAARGYDLYLLHTSYGQHTEDTEYECARRLADRIDAEAFFRVETDHLERIGGSALTDDADAVDDADLGADEVPDTYVPFRNANLLSMAVSYAEANDCDAVFVGAHSEDYSGYPDCRPEFFEAFEAMVDAGTRAETDISIEVPFVDDAKTDIVARGRDLGVPFEHTWSCYRAEAPACGTCDACAYRLQAFQRLDLRDPIEYEERPDYAGSSSADAGSDADGDRRNA